MVEKDEYGVIIRRTTDEDCSGHKCGGIKVYEAIRFGEALRTPSENLLKDLKYLEEMGKQILNRLPHQRSLTLKLNLLDYKNG